MEKLQSFAVSKRNFGPSGFTLIELMVTLAIVAILAIMSVPSFKQYLSGQQLDAMVADFSTSCELARNTALQTNTSVQICPADASGACVAAASNGTGWVVTLQNTTPAVLENHLNTSGSTQAITISSTVATLNFLPSGFMDATQSATVTLTPSACVAGTGKKVTIKFFATGKTTAVYKGCP